MLTLRFVGITADGTQLICESVDTAQQFVIDIDTRLRHALHTESQNPTAPQSRPEPADSASHTSQHRSRQWELTMETQLRPRDIQDRIRAGATVDQVAAAGDMSAEWVEKFAYPVLMERAAMAEKASAIKPFAADPVGSDHADRGELSLAEIVADTLTERGHGTDVTWDAFKDERGWTLCASWMVGRSENRAEWTYQPRADGGAVTPRNDAAADLVDPRPQGLRTIDDDPAQPALEGIGEATVTALKATSSAVEKTASTPDNAAETPAKKRRRGQRPEMPSWEDVLLGTRAAEH